MARTPSPLHSKPIPKRVSRPTETAVTAEAAASVAETAVAPPAKKAPAASKKAKRAPAAKEISGDAAPAPVRAHKPKLVRDSFTMPKDEYQVIDVLKGRALGLQKHVRKSELLRAGIQALAAMTDRAFLKAVDTVPTLKTGRPKGE